MRILARLMSKDLGYICGERESGPNGAKRDFLIKGRAFLSALGKDLGFTEQNVSQNPAGVAVSGELTLMGLWSRDNGLYVQLRQDLMFGTCILYRTIRHMRDFTGGRNYYISADAMRSGDYAALLSGFLFIKETGGEWYAA
jgi:hypothetical protein